MTKSAPAIPFCPSCGAEATRVETRYGWRDQCEPCGLWSWDGKPLVSKEIHEARKHCHAIFDRLWRTAETMYVIEEAPGSKEREQAVQRIRRVARNRAYQFIAEQLGIPEPEAHMADQQDITTLRRIYAAARDATPEQIRAWGRARKEAAAA